jgi:hypothetical protein
MRDTLYLNSKAFQALNVTTISSSGNTDGTAIGLGQSGQNYKSVLFIAECTARTDGTFTLVPQEAVTSGGTYTDVPAARLLGPSGTLTAANTCADVGVIPDPGTSPWVRLRVTASAVTTGGAVTAVAVLGAPSNLPVR